jgi:hypothetical protein
MTVLSQSNVQKNHDEQTKLGGGGIITAKNSTTMESRSIYNEVQRLHQLLLNTLQTRLSK